MEVIDVMDNYTHQAQSFGFMDEFNSEDGKNRKLRKTNVSAKQNLSKNISEQTFDFSSSQIVNPPDVMHTIGEEYENSPHKQNFEDPGRDVLTIGAFYERLNNAIDAVFPNDIWVVGEVRKLRESKGHRYIELVDAVQYEQGTSGGYDTGYLSRQQPVSVGRNTISSGSKTLDIVCWKSNWWSIQRDLEQVNMTLEEGRVIKVRGKVSVWDGAGKVRLVMNKLDVDALLGQIAGQRLRLIRSLKERGIYELNHLKRLPAVPLKIGLITSPQSEGHKDFMGRLAGSGFKFEVFLEPSLVQGQEASRQISEAVQKFAKASVDVICIVRGGGSRNDLAAFDTEEVALAIASSPFPVWTGIGHTGDHSVADMVAHSMFITPTACGEALVDTVANYWKKVIDNTESIVNIAQSAIVFSASALISAKEKLVSKTTDRFQDLCDGLQERSKLVSKACLYQIDRHNLQIAGMQAILPRALASFINQESHILSQRRIMLDALDPKRQMSRGWSLVRDKDGNVIKSIKETKSGDCLLLYMTDGYLDTEVKKVSELY